jgi:protocatechuate 3,4-dioxygenase beta subunit
MERRRFLTVSLGGPLLVTMAARGGARAQPRPLPATPACGDVTPPQTAGPFFKPRSPRRTSLREAGLAGTPLVLTGRVLSTGCAPVARAMLDFWQADDAGEYDNTGFRLRGHQYTDEEGRYQVETIVPGLYPGRTRHIHLVVQAPAGTALTTQLYFAGEPRNRRDGIFDPALELRVDGDRTARRASFDFVLDSAGRRRM